MGRQRAENLHWDLSIEKGREDKSKSRDMSNWSLKTDTETESGKPTWVGYQKDIPEDRLGDRVEILHSDLLKES